jgi:hypothetical protein
MVRLKVGARGSLSPVPVSDQERQEFLKQIVTSPCKELSCGLDDANAGPLFVTAIVERFFDKLVPRFVALGGLGPSDGQAERQKGVALLRVLGEQYAAKTMSYADVAKWVGILAEPMRPQRQQEIDVRFREVYAERLAQAGAPDAVVDMFRQRAGSGRYDLEVAGVARGSVSPTTEADQRAASRLTREWIEQGVDHNLAFVVTRMVSSGRLKAEVARPLVSLIRQYRDHPVRDHAASPAGAELQGQLRGLRISGNNPLYTALNPSATRVPPEFSLPLVKQIGPL